MTRIRVHVIGAHGRMGTTVVEAVGSAHDLELCGASDRADDLREVLRQSRPEVAVEFTTPAAVGMNVRTLLEAGVHVVSGTTGLPLEQARELGVLAERCDLGLLLAPNFSIGVILMQRFARAAVRHLPDVEIIELHHDRKQDAPSGTALHTAALVAAAARGPLNAARPDVTPAIPHCRGGSSHGIPIHSVRLPGLLAHQEVLFGGPGQALTLRHDTLDRQAFVPGILLGIRRIRARRGLVDSLEPFLDD